MRGSAARLVARGNPKEPVPFQEILPLKLRDRVSGKGENLTQVCCLHEMSVLFACFKTHDFNQSPCAKEMETLQKCYMAHLEKEKTRKEKEARGILTPGEKKMSHKQMNILLRNFPLFK